MKHILVINGPNLNLLGLREPDIYGKRTFADLEEYIRLQADALGVQVSLYQSNHEGDIIDRIHHPGKGLLTMERGEAEVQVFQEV